MQKFATARDYPFIVMSQNPKIVSAVIKATLFILWNIYLIFAIKYMADQGQVVLFVCVYSSNNHIFVKHKNKQLR